MHIKKSLKKAKELLEEGNLFSEIREKLDISKEDFPEFRQKFLEEYGRDDIIPLLRKARNKRRNKNMTFERLPEIVNQMENLSIEQIDEMIGNLQATIVELNSIKSDM